MIKDSVIRNIGNSKGLIIPSKLLKEAGWKLDDELEIEVVDNCLIVSKKESDNNENGL